MQSIEVKLNEALAKITALETENKQLKEAVVSGKIEKAKAERANQLKESKLPAPCVARLEEAFKNSTDNAGLKEAINVESDYVKQLTPITKHNGASDNATITEAGQDQQKLEGFKERQFNTYVRSGMSEAQASVASGFKPRK